MLGGVSLTVAIRERVKHVCWQVSVKEQVWKQGSTQELVSYPDLQAPPPSLFANVRLVTMQASAQPRDIFVQNARQPITVQLETAKL